MIIYSVLGLAHATQVPALPEGSVRSLLAFSLVLIFVCLGAFRYKSVDNSALTPCGKAARINNRELSQLFENHEFISRSAVLQGRARAGRRRQAGANRVPQDFEF